MALTRLVVNEEELIVVEDPDPLQGRDQLIPGIYFETTTAGDVKLVLDDLRFEALPGE